MQKAAKWRGIGIAPVVIVITGITVFWIEWWVKSLGH